MDKSVIRFGMLQLCMTGIMWAVGLLEWKTAFMMKHIIPEMSLTETSLWNWFIAGKTKVVLKYMSRNQCMKKRLSLMMAEKHMT